MRQTSSWLRSCSGYQQHPLLNSLQKTGSQYCARSACRLTLLRPSPTPSGSQHPQHSLRLPATSADMAATSTKMKMIDIGANLLDEMYQGRYNDKEYHPPDLDAVLQRTWASGVDKIMITAGNLSEAKAALELSRKDERLFCTVGCHPTRCGEFDSHPGGPADYMAQLAEVLREGQAQGKVAAVGECGLDYERLHFCDKDTQKKYFAMQFELAKQSGLPMFLHLRAATDDFMEIIHQHEVSFVGGVVHSFDGSSEELQKVLVVPKLSIGINGCSLKAEENLEVMAQVPVDRLMIETDCPWCEIRNTHAGKRYIKTSVDAKDRKKHDPAFMVKSRNEPSNLRQVLEVVAGHRGVEDQEALAQQIWHNTSAMFFPQSLEQ